MQDQLSPEKWEMIENSQVTSLSTKRFKKNCDFDTRYLFEDMVQYVFTDDGTVDGHLIPAQLKYLFERREPTWLDDYATATVHAGRKDTLAKFDKVMDELNKVISLPLYDPQRNRLRKTFEKTLNDPTIRYRYPLIRVIIPSLWRADMMMRECSMNQAATQTVVALLQYNKDHGSPPSGLDVLVPDYIQEVPVDVFSGKPLFYFLGQDGQILLYSIGRNMKDDGGSTQMIKEPNRPDQSDVPADIVYWPAKTD